MYVMQTSSTHGAPQIDLFLLGVCIFLFELSMIFSLFLTLCSLLVSHQMCGEKSIIVSLFKDMVLY